MSLSKVTILGNVGNDPRVEELSSGKVAKFSVATTNWDKEKTTTWHNVVAWGKLVEVVEKYVKKGTKLYIEGRLESRKYTNKDGVTVTTWEVTANDIQLLGGKPEEQASEAKEEKKDEPLTENTPKEDMPF